MHVVELALRMRVRNRLAALAIQRAWLSCRKPLRQAIVYGPRSYNLTRMVHSLGGFYQTHASPFTTHVIADADAPPPEIQNARIRCPQWLYRLHSAHASPEQVGLGRSPACNAHDGPVNLPLLSHCDMRAKYRYFKRQADGRFTWEHACVVSYQHGRGYKRSRPDAQVEDVVMSTCTYDVQPPGTFTGPEADKIRRLVLAKCPRTRRIVCLRKGEGKHRFARRLRSFMLARLPRTRKMVGDRPPPAIYRPSLGPPFGPPVYRSLAASAPMARTGEQYMQQHQDDPSAPYYRRYSTGLNLDITCPLCNTMHIVPLGYGTFEGSVVAQRHACPPCCAKGLGSTALAAASC